MSETRPHIKTVNNFVEAYLPEIIEEFQGELEMGHQLGDELLVNNAKDIPVHLAGLLSRDGPKQDALYAARSSFGFAYWLGFHAYKIPGLSFGTFYEEANSRSLILKIHDTVEKRRQTDVRVDALLTCFMDQLDPLGEREELVREIAHLTIMHVEAFQERLIIEEAVRSFNADLDHWDG